MTKPNNAAATSTSKTDWKTYWSDLPEKTWKACVISLAVFVLFLHPLQEMLNTLFIQPFFKSCPQNGMTDLVVSVFLGWSLLYTGRHYWKKLKISPGSWLTILTVTILYLVFFRFNMLYDLYRFTICSKIAYWDAALPAVLFFTATYKTYRLPMPATAASALTLIEDSPLPKSVDDIYEREIFAGKLTEHILATVSQDAFAIGVIGEWGSGKTQFLLRVKAALEKNEETIIVDFNPWRAGKAEAIIDDFFKTLSEALQPYSRSLNQKIRDYSKKILQTGKEVQYRIIDTLLAEWLGETSVQKQYDEINSAIRSIGKRIVILIDDVDRLTGKEVMEVLRLIRNTANFGNTFFVVGLDQRYIVSALRNTKDFANEEEYLEKVFQLTVTLPAFKKEVLVKALQGFLATDDLEAARKKQLEEVVQKISKDFNDVAIPYFPGADHDNILEKMIDNVRDLKRFANSFKIAAHAVGDEADLHDLAVLELIRNKSILVYNSLRDRSLLSFDPARSSEFIIKKETWEAFCKNEGKDIGVTEAAALKEALDYLVTDASYKGPRKFQTVHNFYLYFSYNLFDLISLSEFNEVRLNTAEEIIKQYDQWTADHKGRELMAVSNRLTQFTDAEDLLKMLEVYGRARGNENEWLLITYRLLFEMRQANEQQYFNGDKGAHGAFLKRYFGLSNIPPFFRGRIADYFLKAFLDGTTEPGSLVLIQDEWLDIMAELLRDYLTANPEFGDRTLPMLAFNIQSQTQENFPIISPKSAGIYHDYLLGNADAFVAYVKVMFRAKPGQVFTDKDPTGYYILDPFFAQVFTGQEEFKKQLTSLPKGDADFEEAKSLLLKYVDDYFALGKNPLLINEKTDAKKLRQLLKKYQNYLDLSEPTA